MNESLTSSDSRAATAVVRDGDRALPQGTRPAPFVSFQSAEYAVKAVEPSILVMARKLERAGAAREDLAQVARVAVWRRYPDWQPALSTWHTFSWGVARGAMLQHIRDLSQMIRLPAWLQEAGGKPVRCVSIDVQPENPREGSWADSIPAPSGPDVPLRVDVERAMAKLKPRDAALLRQHYWQDMSIADMARVAGVSARSMWKYVRRAEARVRRRLDVYRMEDLL